MSNEFPIMLAWTLVGSFLLAVLKTGRWKVILVSAVAVWGMSLSRAQIDLLMTGTTEGYAWFAFLSVGILFPAMIVSAIGTDIGASLLSFFKPRKIESEEVAEEIPDKPGTQSG